MAEEKVTTMVLNVDLQCSKCYKRVKKLLCKFPEIRDQTYDEKANKVTIKVVSSSLENIRDKLCCKGGRCIKSIEIVKPPPPKPPPPPPPKPRPPPPPKPEPEPEPKPKPVKVSVDVQVQGSIYCKCCSGRPRGPCSCGGQFQCVLCYCKCCSGRPWGPCSCGGQVQCVLCYGRLVCDSWCVHGSGCGETQQDCSIM
ncbi:hypothetical protein SLEP1_g54530 [Rubroshorea leprosula]|uniref:Protein PYRICULARIA ORYZAE RESISTANCE 21-like n=1 Tax=Rubroshorea leprosula TaxID=152421 RepID=A0AAV5MCP8_9ROSI|nr:hypothetical protein SLEP1_g54530 [Rubroshorea leprosula]